MQYLISSKYYFEAKNQVYKYYKDARLSSKGVYGEEYDVVLLGYDNIMRDISKISFGVDIGRFFSLQLGIIDETDAINKFNKAIEYDSFIIKTDIELSNYISRIVDKLLKHDNPAQALNILTDFYKPSFNNGFSCFIGHDMIKSKILRKINKK